MLTAREVLILAPPGGVEYPSLGALRSAFNIRSVSLRTISQVLGNQRIAMSVQIRSTAVFKNRSIQTLAQLQSLWNDSSAMMSSSDFSTLYTSLKSAGVYLRVNTDQKSGVLIGTASSLAALKIAPLNDGSLHILDNISTGLAEGGGGLTALGGAMMAVGAIPEPLSPGLILVGAALVGTGAGLLIDAGIIDFFFGGDSTPNKPTSSNDTSQDSQPDGEDISVPDGTVWGDVDGDATKLADAIVSLDLTGTPDDFGQGQGLSIPGLGAGDTGSDNSGDFDLGDGGGVDGWGIG